MITEAIINIFLAIPNLLIALLPTTNLSFPDSLTSICDTLFFGLGYILPIGGLMPIFVCSFILSNFRIVWAIILRIKSFIPTMGA